MRLGEKLHIFFDELGESESEAFQDILILNVINALVEDMSGDYKRDLLEVIEKVRDKILNKEV